MKLAFASRYGTGSNIRVNKSGLILFPPSFVETHGLAGKKVKLATDTDDPSGKYAYLKVVEDKISDQDSFTLRKNASGSYVIQCKDFAQDIIREGKKAQLVFVKNIENNGTEFMQLSVLRIHGKIEA